MGSTFGGGGSPASPTTAIQFNNAGSFGGDSTITIQGTPPALVVTNTGSAFGNLAIANNNVTFPYADSGTGFAVLQGTSDPTYNYNAFLVDVIVNSDKYGQAATFDVEVQQGTTNGIAGIVVNLFPNGHTVAGVVGQDIQLHLAGSTVPDYIVGSQVQTSTTAGLAVTGLKQYRSYINNAGATVPIAYGFTFEYAQSSGSTTTIAANWVQALGGLATNPYSFWSDEQGVFRIRADNTFNSVYQAIPALYNPQFTKYTPGAANYERCVPGCQWDTNVAVFTTEKGGTGTLRGMTFGASGSVPVSVYGVTPVTRQLLATGAAHTVDDVITVLQTFGLCKQS